MKLKSVITFSIFLGLIAANCFAAAARPDIELSVFEAPRATGDVFLQIDLQNHGASPLTIYRSALPWGVRDSLLLVAICLDGSKTVLEPANYIDDPSPEQMQLVAGQKLSGTIALGRRFPDLRKCLQRRNALIFWSYELAPISDSVRFPRTSGGVVLEQRK
jgi:hypothetical protein